MAERGRGRGIQEPVTQYSYMQWQAKAVTHCTAAKGRGQGCKAQLRVGVKEARRCSIKKAVGRNMVVIYFCKKRASLDNNAK